MSIAFGSASFISKTVDLSDPYSRMRDERSGYYSNINLVAAIGEWTWRPARTLLISYKSGLYADEAFTRRVCAQSTVNDVSKLFSFPLFTIHL